MTHGRPAWNPNISDLTDAIHKCRGNITAVGKKMGVGKETIFKFVKQNPNIREIVEEARWQHAEDEIELAVSLNYKFMQAYEENPSLASRHVIYTLDKKGHSRGYLRDSNAEPLTAKNQPQIDLTHENMMLKHENQELKDNADKPQTE